MITAADVADDDDGKLSLREAVAQANNTTAADRIVFATGLEGKMLTLTDGELVLRQDVTIDRPQSGLLCWRCALGQFRGHHRQQHHREQSGLKQL